VVCLARDELVESQPGFLEGRGNVDRIELDALSAEETEALLDGLGGGILESDQRTRVVEAAEGNPLFLEQLLALALEGGLVEQRVPETIQALLAARLDRLGPGERAVLERGAVIGKEFAGDDLVALLDPDAVPTADAHIATLVGRGFVRPRGEGAFGFRHVLVQDAVYRAAPKRLRAELHERYADRLDTESPELPDLDEFVGYHLEQAYGLRTELGVSDRRTERLAEDGGQRLGDAGVRAAKRGDIPATVSLLSRASALLPENEPLRRELQCELAIGLRASGDFAAASQLLEAVVDKACEVGDRRLEFRARIEYAYIRTGFTDTLLEAAHDGIPIFEIAHDHRSLGRAHLLVGAVQGARRGRHKAREEAAERALTHYERSGWPAATCLGEIATALYQGPTPTTEGIRRIEELRRTVPSDRIARAHLEVMLAALLAQRGRFDEARELAVNAKATYTELGQAAASAIYATAIRADIERLAGDSAVAKEVYVELCRDLDRIRAYGPLASAAGDLAATLYTEGLFDESEDWVSVAERHSADDDLDARLHWIPVRAKLAGRRLLLAEAERLAAEAVRLSHSTDALNLRAATYADFGEVLQLAGDSRRAAAQFREAFGLYELKGNVVGAARVRALQDGLVFV
jgi:tetratricopeptide (TPR) repeat protein